MKIKKTNMEKEERNELRVCWVFFFVGSNLEARNIFANEHISEPLFCSRTIPSRSVARARRDEAFFSEQKMDIMRLAMFLQNGYVVRDRCFFFGFIGFVFCILFV